MTVNPQQLYYDIFVYCSISGQILLQREFALAAITINTPIVILVQFEAIRPIIATSRTLTVKFRLAAQSWVTPRNYVSPMRQRLVQPVFTSWSLASMVIIIHEISFSFVLYHIKKVFVKGLWLFGEVIFIKPHNPLTQLHLKFLLFSTKYQKIIADNIFTLYNTNN